MWPEVLAAVSIGGSAASGTLGFFGALGQGKAESGMYKYRAGMAQFNKQIMEQNRDYALVTGEQEAGRYGLKARQTAGAIRAQQGASGINVNTGSAVDVQESQAQIAKMDMATIRSNAARTAYGYQVEATKYGAESGMYEAAAKNAKKAAMINAIGSLIGGATSVSSKWLQAKQYGIFGKTASEDLIYGPGY